MNVKKALSNITQEYLNEIVMYGGLPCKRIDMIQHAHETLNDPEYFLFCKDQFDDRLKLNDPELWKHYQSLKPYSYELLITMV